MYSKSVVARSSQKQHSKRIISIIYFLSGWVTRKSQKFHTFCLLSIQCNIISWMLLGMLGIEPYLFFLEPTAPFISIFQSSLISGIGSRMHLQLQQPEIFCIKNVLLNLIQMCGRNGYYRYLLSLIYYLYYLLPIFTHWSLTPTRF